VEASVYLVHCAVGQTKLALSDDSTVQFLVASDDWKEKCC
jgi:hypothetical protein